MLLLAERGVRSLNEFISRRILNPARFDQQAIEITLVGWVIWGVATTCEYIQRVACSGDRVRADDCFGTVAISTVGTLGCAGFAPRRRMGHRWALGVDRWKSASFVAPVGVSSRHGGTFQVKLTPS